MLQSQLIASLLGLLLATPVLAADLLLKNLTVYDGSGQAPFAADVRIRADRIAQVAPHLVPRPGERVHDEHGLALAPGFIDMHSHGDGGLLQDPDAATIARQGVTTILVGQDGESHFPLRDWYAQLAASPASINVASMIGHATLRQQAMGTDLYRPSTPQELVRMQALLADELKAGAFGLSTGLEYEQAHFATTEEVVALSKMVAAAGGFYISHVRDEGMHVFDSYDEILRIGRDARVPVEITHIKLGSPGVWHLAATRMPGYFATAAREHIQLTADVYPYTYWHSTIRVIVPDRDFFNPAKVSQGLTDNGGAAAIRLVHYAPEPALEGKTLDVIAAGWQLDPVTAYMRIVRATSAEVNSSGPPLEEIIGTSMLPAQQLGLKDRGRVADGYAADLVLFDPATVIDRSTIEQPEAAPVGIPGVMVAGVWVIEDGQVTGKHPGRVLKPAPAAH